jgi:hypothetical protein
MTDPIDPIPGVPPGLEYLSLVDELKVEQLVGLFQGKFFKFLIAKKSKNLPNLEKFFLN